MPGSQNGEHNEQSAHDIRQFQLLQGPNSGTKSGIESMGDDLEPSAADNLKSLVQECGVSPHKISELLQELPPLRSSDVLVDYYFSSMCVHCNSMCIVRMDLHAMCLLLQKLDPIPCI